MNDLYLTEAMQKFNKKFYHNTFNILNSYAGSGKTNFIFNEFLTNTKQYIDKNIKDNYNKTLGNILYVCDTTMLKESVLNDNKNITKVLSKNDLKRTMKADGFEYDNKIIVITYSSFGFLLNNKASNYIINNYFKCVIMDEIHNLFKYAYKFKSDTNNNYNTIIQNMNKLILNKNVLLIGMTATVGNMYYKMNMDGFVAYHTIFNTNELNRIRKYKEDKHIFCKYPINVVKYIALEKDNIKEKYNKIFIYTNTISVAEKYKAILKEAGYNVEYLCSLNSKNMNDKQIMLRDFIIKNNCYPDYLDVLIVNGAYETGWNLKDDNVQLAIIDTTQGDIQIQARNRIRHNIKTLYTREIIDNEGIAYDRDEYKELHKYNESCTFLRQILPTYLDNKYINKKLSKEDKQYIVEHYTSILNDKKRSTWQTFKTELKECTPYKVITGRKGTYIIKDTQTLKEALKESIEVMNDNNELISYLNSVIGKKLDKQEQKILIKNIGLTDTRGRQVKSINILNAYLIENYNKTLISKRVKINNKLCTVWIISNLK